MKIGKLVQGHIKEIFKYCEITDHEELVNLTNAEYSKNIFGINFPFCLESSQISKEFSKRFYTTHYVVRGVSYRVCSQWFMQSKPQFLAYLEMLKINLNTAENSLPERASNLENKKIEGPTNSRYKGNAIANAQNLTVRNILSNLGSESFKKQDWENTLKYFDHSCAYCGATDEKLVMEHIVPINRKSLGEHRLGNLVPSCKQCNDNKKDDDFREFLSQNPAQLEIIEQFMDQNNYVPLGDNEQVELILDIAYREVSDVAAKYVKIINSLLPQ